MSDVAEVKKALEWVGQGEAPMPGSSLAVIFEAARRWVGQASTPITANAGATPRA